MPERETDAAAGSPLSESELDAIVRINADDPTAEVYAGYPTMTVRRLVAELRRLRTSQNTARQRLIEANPLIFDADGRIDHDLPLETVAAECAEKIEHLRRLHSDACNGMETLAILIPVWTATPPTEPGQYWLKTPKFWTPVVVEVYLRDDGLLGVSYCGGRDDLAPFDGQWAGPLSPPTSPLPPPGPAR